MKNIKKRNASRKKKIWNGCGLAAHRHAQKRKYNISAMSFEQFDLFHEISLVLTSKYHNSIITDV